MSVKVQPMADYVVAQIAEAKSKTASGLYIPGGVAEKSKVAQIVSVGADVKGVKIGDRILFKNEYETTNVKVENENYLIVDQKNIVAIVG